MSKQLEVAIKVAKLAGEKLEYYFETVLEHEEKEDKSLVTKADLEAEEIIVKKLKDAFPDHNIFSEESGDHGVKSEYTWVLDPLDGTLNFTRGLPIFATSIALVKDSQPLLSVTYNPVIKSLYWAEKDKGAFWNEEKIKVSDNTDVSRAVITLGRARDAENKKKTNEILNKIYFKTHQRILGSSALELAWVASGRTEGFISVGLKNWDVYGGMLLVEEAGGKITDFQGHPLQDDKRYFVASNGKIHRELQEILNN
ncbi:MAG: inositol monophosphatase [bacterium]|nr:inositol monophosphatase [bacterium]